MKKYNGDTQKKWAAIIAKAWTDSAFKHKLMNDPKAAFKEYGIEMPESGNYKVLEETAQMHYFILPEKPAGNLSAKELESIAAAGHKPPMAL